MNSLLNSMAVLIHRAMQVHSAVAHQNMDHLIKRTVCKSAIKKVQRENIIEIKTDINHPDPSA